jgi:hypothetical protein
MDPEEITCEGADWTPLVKDLWPRLHVMTAVPSFAAVGVHISMHYGRISQPTLVFFVSSSVRAVDRTVMWSWSLSYGRRSVDQFVLVSGSPLGPTTRFYLFFFV